LELLGICSLVTEENFTKTKSLNHFAIPNQEYIHFIKQINNDKKKNQIWQ